MTESDQPLLQSFVRTANGAAANGDAPVFCPDGIPGLLDLPHAPRRVLCGDMDIRIDRNGLWYYAGSPIGRKELVKLFASVLKKDRKGGYWMATPAELARIHVEDVPFMAVEMMAHGVGRDQQLLFRTNVDREVPLNKEHSLRIDIADNGEPFPYIHLGDGIEARLTRSVYYHLVEAGGDEIVDDRPCYGIWSNGEFFVIGAPD